MPTEKYENKKESSEKIGVDDELLRMIYARNTLYAPHINEPNEFSYAQFKDQRNLGNSTRRKKMTFMAKNLRKLHQTLKPL